MAHHVLKTDPEVFEQSWSGVKPWEIRHDDRGYTVGDSVLLQETRHACSEMAQGAPLEFTGRKIHGVITAIVRGYGLQPGWVVFTVDQWDRFTDYLTEIL